MRLTAPAGSGGVPKRFPRALAAARAALVRSEIGSRSCSATAARMWMVSLLAWGLSTAGNSAPDSHQTPGRRGCDPGLLRRRVPGYAKAPTCNNTAFTVVRVCSSNFARARSRSPVDRRPLASGGMSGGASLPKRSARSSSASTTARRIAACKEVPFSNASISSRDGRRSMDG